MGSFIDVKLEQPAKQLSPNDVMPSCNVIPESFLQLLKAKPGRFVIFCGNVTVSRFSHELKHPIPNLVMLFGSVNFVMLQPKKQDTPNDISFFGSSITDKSLQPINVSSPNDVILSGSFTDVKLWQNLKQLFPNDVMLFGSVMPVMSVFWNAPLVALTTE